MMRKKSAFLLVVLGLGAVCTQTLAAQPAGRAQGQAIQPSNEFQVERVSLKEELVQPAPRRSPTDLPGKETVKPIPGRIFVVIHFVLLADTSATSPVLVDSVGTRYTPVGSSPFSTEEFQFFEPRDHDGRVLASVKAERFPGGKVEAARDQTTGEMTIKVAERGTKFSVVWVVPREIALPRAKLKLHLGNTAPIVVNIPASAR